MYGLPQAGRIANDALIEHLAPYGYAPVKHTPGLWKHTSRPLTFTLVVDNFGVKYERCSDAEHLKAALETRYKMTTDWDGKLYVGITLKWDYDNRQVQCSMPGYIEAMLHRFQYKKPNRPQDSPYPCTIPVHGKSSQIIKPTKQLPLLPKEDRDLIPQVVGVGLYYGLAVDSTMLPALNELATAANEATSATADALTHFLDYCATHPDAEITYDAKSDMILYIHSDASYLCAPKARSRYGGFFFLGRKQTKNKTMAPLNGPILVLCQLLRLVVASSFEAELGGMFHNAQDGEYIRLILEEMGHPQPATPMITDNLAAEMIANDIGKQKRSKAIDMRFYWLKDRIKLGHFNVFWRPGTENIADYSTKHFPASHHRAMRPIVLNQSAFQQMAANVLKLHSPEQAYMPPRGCVDTGK